MENLGQMVNLSNWLINSIEGIGFWVAKNNVLPGWNSGGVSIRGMTDTHKSIEENFKYPKFRLNITIHSSGKLKG